METLRIVLTVQAIVLLIYGVPYLLVPSSTHAITGQPPVPEPYFLRVIGAAFIVLAWLETRIAADLSSYRRLTLPYAVFPAFLFVTIAIQFVTTGFNGAAWYWWLNLVVTGVFAIAVFAAGRRGHA